MSETISHFDKRVRKIARKNRRLARGSEKYIDATGVMRERPRRSITNLPIKGLFLVALGFFAFKGFLLAHQGVEGYKDRLEVLNNGTVFEQFGAWLMQIEPVTARFAGFFAPFV